MLDAAGLPYVRIIASNEVDEFIIHDVLAQGGKVDIWGVGTNLVVGAGPGGSALGGVYKLVEHAGRPKIKLSSNPEKMTNPGVKKVIRFYNPDEMMEADALAWESEDLNQDDTLIIDPSNPLRRKKLETLEHSELLEDIVRQGRQVYEFPSLESTRRRRADQLRHLHESYKRLHNPHEYKVGVTLKLWQMKEQMLNQATV
jgi:nicotinate phosphoribosyltransferase